MTTNTYDALRKRADKHGLQLHSIPKKSRYFWDYGPYMITNRDGHGVVSRALTLDEAAQAIADYAS